MSTNANHPPEGESGGTEGDAPRAAHSDATSTAHTNTNAQTLVEPPVGGALRLSDGDLPYRFKESTFKLYEPYIAKAIATGEPVEINPAPIRATTFAARARDAIIAKRRFNWPASFTALQLAEADLTVRHGEHTVIIGPKHRLSKPTRILGEQVAFATPDHKRLGGVFIDREPTAKELEAIAVLLGSKILSGPFIIRAPLGTASIAELDRLEGLFDIAVTPPNVRGETIIL